MSTVNNSIQQHYRTEHLYEEILSRFAEINKYPGNIARADLAPVDEFHVRGAAVSKELAESVDLQFKRVLDIGSGLGGAARMLADLYDCEVTGIDLCSEYVDVANQLSKLVNLDRLTTFVQGDATSLPFRDGAFNVVWTQHVQMNIQDKHKLYSEIKRMLDYPPLRGGAFQRSWKVGEPTHPKTGPETGPINKSVKNQVSQAEEYSKTQKSSIAEQPKTDQSKAGQHQSGVERQSASKSQGIFLYYDLFKKNDEAVSYPMPWATHEGQSFLMKKEELHNLLFELGFQKVLTTNQTDAGISFFENLFEKIALSGPPKLSLSVLMGESTGPKLKNLLDHLKNGALELESGIFTI